MGPKGFAKFVLVTGALDFLVGLVTWGAAIADPQPGLFVALLPLGSFLFMAAALLMWASRDIEARAPVIFWQALVRLTAAAAIVYAVPNGLAESREYGLVFFDGPIALVYVWGSIRLTRWTLPALLTPWRQPTAT